MELLEPSGILLQLVSFSLFCLFFFYNVCIEEAVNLIEFQKVHKIIYSIVFLLGQIGCDGRGGAAQVAKGSKLH